MAIFLRGDVWWFEYRTRRERVVKSTGFHKKDKKKAQAVLDAFRLARSTGASRSAMANVLDAIYSGKPVSPRQGLALSSMWEVYLDWYNGKGRNNSNMTVTNRRNLLASFIAWAEAKGCKYAEDIDVAITRQFIASLREKGLSNKTQRTYGTYLSAIWKAVGQLKSNLGNPWSAAIPDNDGSSKRLEAFTHEEEVRVLNAARDAGRGWYLASMIARWTGLRYGDVAHLDWADIDLDARLIRFTPNKTKKHGVRVTLPIAEPLYDALVAASPNRSGFVLPEHGAAYGHGGLKSQEGAFADVLKSAGLDTDYYTFHSWRHTFRTRLAEAGVSDDAARRLGGWTNLKMAAHYDHATHIAELRSAVSLMEGANRKS